MIKRCYCRVGPVLDIYRAMCTVIFVLVGVGLVRCEGGAEVPLLTQGPKVPPQIDGNCVLLTKHGSSSTAPDRRMIVICSEDLSRVVSLKSNTIEPLLWVVLEPEIDLRRSLAEFLSGYSGQVALWFDGRKVSEELSQVLVQQSQLTFPIANEGVLQAIVQAISPAGLRSGALVQERSIGEISVGMGLSRALMHAEGCANRIGVHGEGGSLRREDLSQLYVVLDCYGLTAVLEFTDELSIRRISVVKGRGETRAGLGVGSTIAQVKSSLSSLSVAEGPDGLCLSTIEAPNLHYCLGLFGSGTLPTADGVLSSDVYDAHVVRSLVIE